MTDDDRYKLFGVYVSPPVAEALTEHLYAEAGVIEFREYFEPTADSVPVGDPGAEATDAFVAALVDEFATLYDRADFEAAAGVDPGAFELLQFAADPRRASALRERFRAAETIREADLRTVQTAIIAAALGVAPDGDADADVDVDMDTDSTSS